MRIDYHLSYYSDSVPLFGGCRACVARQEAIAVLERQLAEANNHLSEERAAHSETRKALTHVVDVRAGALAFRKPPAAAAKETDNPKSPYDAMTEKPSGLIAPDGSPFRVGMTEDQVEAVLSEARNGKPVAG